MITKSYLAIALLTITLIFGSFIAFASAGPRSNAPQIRLKWEITNYYNDDEQNTHTRSHFIITNNGRAPFASANWSIYFNAIAGAVTPVSNGNATVEHITGTLFRVTPNTKIALRRGQSQTLNLEHWEALSRIEKAPIGPYLVYDNAPNIGYAISDFRRVSLPRHAAIQNSNQSTSFEVSASQLYDANAKITKFAAADLPPIFPLPLSYQYGPNGLLLTQNPAIEASANLAAEAQFAREIFAGIDMPQNRQATVPLKLEIGNIANSSPEAYQLKIDQATGIAITANSKIGIYYGLQSLKQLMQNAQSSGGTTMLRELMIIDAPRFAFRGLLIDVARNFQNKDKIKSIIDLMARYKLNKLHLHLTDDEGWRLQINQIPELTTYGGRRGHGATQSEMLPPAYGSGAAATDPHGSGFYTQADYVEILRYAAARHIEVIPEIEMPGHQRSAVKAMEARYHRLKAQNNANAGQYLLSDLQDRSHYRSAQLYTDNVINPALPSTYAFVEAVTSELAAMHARAGVPLKTLHMGADELATGAWEGSPLATAFMQSEGLAGTADLWNYYYDRIETILARHNIKMAGWEELGLRKEKIDGHWKIGINPHYIGHDFTLFVWNNLEGSEDLGYKLANAGYKVVLAPVTNLYFDMAHNRDVSEPGHDWANFTDLKHVFEFSPFAMVGENKVQLSPAGRANITGIEATMFSETMRDSERVDYMLMPRLLALAERAWSKPPAWETGNAGAEFDSDYSRFANQIGVQVLPIIDREMPRLAYRVARPGLKIIGGVVHANHELPGTILRYSIGNSLPTNQSPIYSAPIVAKGKVNVAAFTRNGRRGPAATVTNN